MSALPSPHRIYVSPLGFLHGLGKVDLFGTLDDFHNRDTGLGPEPKLTTTANDLRTDPPSAYTGAMARLVQYHYSRSPGIANPYSHQYFNTHGLHIDANGNPWVIAINAFAGVNARPLAVDGAAPVNAGAPNDKGGFQFTPIIEPLPGTNDPSWRNLLPGAGLSSLAGSPWDAEGWAFNDDGTEAVIVLKDQSNPPVVRNATLWQIQITGDATGPTAATLTNLESGWFGGADSGSDEMHLKFWRQQNDRVQSFSIDFAGTPPPGKSDAPIYAYYKSNALEVIRWHYEAEATNVNFNNPTPGNLDEGTFGNDTETTSTACFSSGALPEVQNRVQVKRIATVVHGAPVVGMLVNKFASCTPVHAITQPADNVDIDETFTDVLILPMRDRSSAYHLRFERRRNFQESTGTSPEGWRISEGLVYQAVPPPSGDVRQWVYSGPAPGTEAAQDITGFGPARVVQITSPEIDRTADQFTATVLGFTESGADQTSAATTAIASYNAANPGNLATFSGLNVTTPGNVPGSGTWNAEINGTVDGGPVIIIGSVSDYGREFAPLASYQPLSTTFTAQVNDNLDLRQVKLINLGPDIDVPNTFYNVFAQVEFSFNGQLITVIQSHGATPQVIYTIRPVEYERRFLGDLVGRYDGAALYAPAAINAFSLSWVGNP